MCASIASWLFSSGSLDLPFLLPIRELSIALDEIFAVGLNSLLSLPIVSMAPAFANSTVGSSSVVSAASNSDYASGRFSLRFLDGAFL
jgi:hypothetical protein